VNDAIVVIAPSTDPSRIASTIGPIIGRNGPASRYSGSRSSKLDHLENRSRSSKPKWLCERLCTSMRQ